MKILYSAIDQQVPGTLGGSTHVTAVASGLAALGHDVHVLTTPGTGPFPSDGATWHALAPPMGVRHLRILRSRRVLELAKRLNPDLIIERYYNFGGESVRAARDTDAALVLEVNAPIVDYPGSPKQAIDRALLVQPMRRWREWQCAAADLVVTPRASIVPASVPREKVLEIEWGADTRQFHPRATGAVPYVRKPGETVAVFAGAFRPWHGARHLVDAIRLLRARGRSDVVAVFVGDGPELPSVRQAAEGLTGITFTGAVNHACMPACIAAADAGVAPFDVAAHAPLSLDFYWSPLKIFEYMASGLPVVAPGIARLRQIVADSREGLLYEPGSTEALAGALERLTDPALRQTLGAAARERVVRDFSWDVHCRKLDEAFRRCAS